MALFIGTNLDDAIDGTTADDQIFGLAGNDTLGGEDGNDLIEGGEGDDLLDGGLGVDTLSYESAVAAVILDLGLKTAQNTGGAGIDTLSNFENLLGSAFDDVFVGTGSANVIEGGAGNDILDGAGGGDTASYAGSGAAVTVDLAIAGPQDTLGAGLDTLTNFQNLLGSAFNDRLAGDAADNVIEGGAGNDLMDGLAGLDTVSYAGATSGVSVDLSLGGPQDTAGAGIDTFTNFENLTGSAFGDLLTGSAGANVLDGGGGVDTVSYANASAGVRVSLALATAQNTVGAGLDTVLSFENLTGSAFDDTLTGTAEANVIAGIAGGDTIDAAAGDDSVDGGDGNDTVFAGLGNDAVLGGTGDDALYGDATSAAIAGLPGINRFTPFNPNTSAQQMANHLLPQGAGVTVQSASFAGEFTSASSFIGINYAPTIALGHGLLLTTGSGTPALVNTTFNAGIDTRARGDAALDAVAQAAFAGAGRTEDASVLEIRFTVADPAASRVSLDLIFGSDEFPEFVDSAFVDVAAVWIDGVNYALFNGDPLQPLSIIGNNVNHGNFAANGAFPIEYDGISSTLRVVGSLDPALGTHTLRVGIADTGDGLYDSGLYVSNFTVSNDAAGIELLAHDTLSGGDGNDTIDGGIGNDVLDGGAGSDTASYASASSRVVVDLRVAGPQDTAGAGTDTLAGFENLSGSNFDDTLTGDAGDNSLAGGLGDDLLDGGEGADTASYATAIVGISVDLGRTGAQDTVGAGIDTLLNFEHILGSGFDDVLTGNDLANTIRGEAGKDTLDGGAGSDRLFGGAGDDRYRVDNAGDIVTEAAGAGIDTVLSTANAYVLAANVENLGFAGTGNFTGTGNALANALAGGSGADILRGGAGADTMAGGAGNDVYAVDNGADVVTEAPGAGTDTVQATTTYTLPDNVENLVLAGNAAINGSGNGLANALTGNAGNNVLNGGAGVDTASYANAAAGVSVSLASSTAQDTLGAGSDTLIAIEALIGSAFNDRLTGNAGANTLVGGLGDDVLDGGAGIDTASFANAAAGVSVDLGVTGPQATFGAGIDTLVAVENLSGSRFDDTLTGNGLNNLLFGGLGNDVLNGAGGVDTASYGGAAFAVVVDLAAGTAGGGAGSDLLANVENLAGSSFADTLTGNSLNNVLDGGQGNDAIDGGAGVDTASYASATGGVSVTLAAPGVQQNTLGAGLDTLGNVENLTGSNLNDTLTGDAGANTLAGGLGNDVLDGAGGNDVLAGGPGADLLTGGSGIDFFYFNSVAGSDSITDFVSGTDRFRFSQAGMPIGDGDTAIEGGLVVSGPGGFTPGNELVILAGDIAGAIDAASAAAAIGAAGAAYAPGATVLFAVDDGLSSGIFRFVSAGADAVVSAEELTQIADLTGTPGTALADYVFVA